MTKTKDLLKSMETPRKKEPPVKTADLLSTGSTQLDVALSDRIRGGFPKGKYILIVGDSESGKTWFSMSCLAEATINPEFKDYRLIHIDPEDGASMDKAAYFGKELEKRIEVIDPPPKTAEEMYDLLDDLLDEKRPFIAIVDSDNALTTRADLKAIKKQKAARRKNEDEGGGMGMAKAKIHSERLRIVRNRLRENRSMLVIISQTRQRVGFAAKFDPKTRGGGDALKFFADLEIWTSIYKRIRTKKKVKGKEREIGMTVKVQVKKNRITSRKSSVLVDFYHEFGIDNTGSCVKYLIDEQHWKDNNGVINAKEFNMQLPFEKLVAWIESAEMEPELHKLVKKTWEEIKEESSIKRKRRYS